MYNSLNDLRRTVQVDAPDSHLSLLPHHFASARRALLGNGEMLFSPRSFLLYNGDYVGYDVTGPLNDNTITDPDIFAGHLVPVVERTPGDRDAADADRLKHGIWR